jgi:type II secretory pathway pseudopilin PulG
MGSKKRDFLSKAEGFSLIEALVAIVLIAIALLGLAQMFTLSLLNNTRADKITNATFLAQQQIDSLRNMTVTELNALTSGPIDELLDLNNDGYVDFRRITDLNSSGYSYEVRVLIFTEPHSGVSPGNLIQNPNDYKVMADIQTLIGR